MSYEPGIYVKGDERRQAYTRSAAVALTFDGFRLEESTDSAQEQDAPTTPTETANTASLFDSQEDPSE